MNARPRARLAQSELIYSVIAMRMSNISFILVLYIIIDIVCYCQYDD
jgi:hypothetical protein